MKTFTPNARPKQSQEFDAGCAPSSLWGWSPPPMPANGKLERAVDRLMPRTGLELVLFYGFVIALLSIAPHLPRRAELAADGVAFLGAGGWCALNFWRCRHAHCVVTAAAWLPLAAFAFVEAAIGRSLIRGFEQPIFLGFLALGIVFEVVWQRSRGTNAIGRPAC